MNTDNMAAGPPGARSSAPGPPQAANQAQEEALERKIEQMFDKADDLMINKEKFQEAVSIHALSYSLLIRLFAYIFLTFRNKFTWRFWSWTRRISMGLIR